MIGTWMVMAAGAQTFLPAADDEFTVSVAAQALRAADLNADGYDDLLVAADRRISTYPGSPAGVASAAASRFTTQDPVGDFVLLDVNGDGLTDLATVEVTYGGGYYSPRYEIRLYAGVAGGFAPGAVQSSNLSLERATISAGDFDGDGRSDLVACTRHTAGGSVVSRCSLLLGQPAGTVTMARSADMGAVRFANAHFGDVDGDGLDDIVLCASDAALPLVIVPGNASGVVGATTSVPIPAGWSDNGTCAVGGDLDGDGIGDITAGIYQAGGGPTGILVVPGGAAGPGAPRIVTGMIDGLVPTQMEISGDVDGDGHADLLAANAAGDGVISVWRSGTVAPADPGPYVTRGRASTAAAGFAITSGDFDGDGHADRAYLGYPSLALSVTVGIEYGP
ncbi:MAG: VCBS repeat-containing protein [Alphaproteobacteria bacterium]|nr:VCBS repeat-containing protein [Alphaproteobacteria bacterium]